MADTKISALASATSMADADVLPVVVNMATVPVTKSLTWAYVKSILKTYFDAIYQAAGSYITASSTDTLTNKRITPRITQLASSGTPTFNTDSCDVLDITALAAAITDMSANMTGTPTNCQRLLVRIKDNGTARALSWGTGFEAKGVILPTTTVISKLLTVGFVYSTASGKWGCVAVAQEA